MGSEMRFVQYRFHNLKQPVKYPELDYYAC